MRGSADWIDNNCICRTQKVTYVVLLLFYEVSVCLETSRHYLCVWSVTVRECTVLFDCLLCFVLMDGAFEWQMALQPADVLSHTRGSTHTNTTTQLSALDHQHVHFFNWGEGFPRFIYYIWRFPQAGYKIKLKKS